MTATRPRLAAVAAMGLGALALSGCAVLGPAADGTGSDTIAEKTTTVPLLNPDQLSVCADVPYPPFEFFEGNTLVGYDIDIAQRIADDLGVRLNVVDTSFEGIESGASLSGCDLNQSSISITEERQRLMGFSLPYLDDDLVLVSGKDSGITDIDSAQGRRVGVQAATTGEAYAEEQGLNTVQFEDGGMQLEALKAGTVDALLGNQSVILYGLKDDERFSVVDSFDTGESLGIGVSPENSLLLSAVNRSLTEMEEDGTLHELRTKWFGQEAADAHVTQSGAAAGSASTDTEEDGQ